MPPSRLSAEYRNPNLEIRNLSAPRPASAAGALLSKTVTAYITFDQIISGLPDEITDQLLDDSESGEPDMDIWQQIIAAVGQEIDGKIGQRYALPLSDPLPQVLLNAGFVLAAELLYQRRGFFGDANPWTRRAESIRGTAGRQGGQPGLLDAIVAGTIPLSPDLNRKQPSVSVIAERTRTHSRTGRLSI